MHCMQSNQQFTNVQWMLVNEWRTIKIIIRVKQIEYEVAVLSFIPKPNENDYENDEEE